jgi:heat shock protein HslJ
MCQTFVRAASFTMAMVACHPQSGGAQGKVAAWLDERKPAAWNQASRSIPASPKTPEPVDSKCRALARSSELDEDKRVRDQGWDLVGAYQGGWQIRVIRGTAGYDGMCRPRQYQDFVFIRGMFAGTLSPQPMDSRTDGALSRVFLRSGSEVVAEYDRYAADDPLCCPSRTTTVVFNASSDPPVVQPVSASSTEPRKTGSPSSAGLAGTSWQLVAFEGGDGTTLTPDDRTKYTIELGAGGRLAARIDCNRGRGTWKTSGSNQIEFGPMALTRAKCPTGSLHDQIVKQWASIRSYVRKDGHLFLSLAADGGIYELEPIAVTKK